VSRSVENLAAAGVGAVGFAGIARGSGIWMMSVRGGAAPS
jgi:hypothetical protein